MPVFFLLSKLLNKQCIKITVMKGQTNTYVTRFTVRAIRLGFRVEP